MTRSLRRLAKGLVAGAAVVLTVVLASIVTGQARFVVTHGVSMNPVYYQGDLVVIAKKPAYEIGQIVAYHRPGHSDVVLHRIIGGDASGYTFKGDNNQSIDPTKPSESQLAGTAVLHIPRGGIWLRGITSPAVLAGFAFLLMGAGGTAALQTRRQRKRRGTMSRHAARTRSKPTLTGLPEPLRNVATASAAIGVVALAVGGLAWTGPLSSLVTVKQDSSRSVTFSYSAVVPRGPAYAGTTATSPDPIFRKLANGVDVHVAYDGAPGSIAITGELSTGSGWHASIPLAPTTTFTAPRYRGTVHLDLAALQARATAAGIATGIPSDQLTVKVVPEIRSGTAQLFTPALALSLTPLQLKLTGDNASLIVTDSTAGSTRTSTARRIGALGHSISVGSARSLSLMALLLSLLVGAAVWLLARRTAPSSEAASIRQRYASLLVPVHPMPTAAGRPVVDVTDFPTLAKLAERYGLLVLHWSRSGVETFVVQDEGATFRYRAGGARVDGERRQPSDDTHHTSSSTPA